LADAEKYSVGETGLSDPLTLALVLSALDSGLACHDGDAEGDAEFRGTEMSFRSLQVPSQEKITSRVLLDAGKG